MKIVVLIFSAVFCISSTQPSTQRQFQLGVPERPESSETIKKAYHEAWYKSIFLTPIFGRLNVEVGDLGESVVTSFREEAIEMLLEEKKKVKNFFVFIQALVKNETEYDYAFWKSRRTKKDSLVFFKKHLEEITTKIANNEQECLNVVQSRTGSSARLVLPHEQINQLIACLEIEGKEKELHYLHFFQLCEAYKMPLEEVMSLCQNNIWNRFSKYTPSKYRYEQFIQFVRWSISQKVIPKPDNGKNSMSIFAPHYASDRY